MKYLKKITAKSAVSITLAAKQKIRIIWKKKKT